MIKIGAPVTTIDTPLEHLMACHRRIDDRLATLERAADHWRTTPKIALEAIHKSILFLDSSGVLHTMDEEESLFPRLRPHLTAEEAAHLDRLERQHVTTELVFTELKDVIAQIASSPQPTASLERRYRELVAELNNLYRPHMQFEDEVLAPLARRLLDEEELKDIALEMKIRRKKAEPDEAS